MSWLHPCLQHDKHFANTPIGMALLANFQQEKSICFTLIFIVTYPYLYFVVKAFHLKFDEMATDANVKKWDVHVLTVSDTVFIVKCCELRNV